MRTVTVPKLVILPLQSFPCYRIFRLNPPLSQSPPVAAGMKQTRRSWVTFRFPLCHSCFPSVLVPIRSEACILGIVTQKVFSVLESVNPSSEVCLSFYPPLHRTNLPCYFRLSSPSVGTRHPDLLNCSLSSPLTSVPSSPSSFWNASLFWGFSGKSLGSRFPPCSGSSILLLYQLLLFFFLPSPLAPTAIFPLPPLWH